jgi:sugar lactone lactonase YvrE
LILVDQTNGTGTFIGTPVPGVGLSGIAFHLDGRLFASTVTSGNPSTLIQINPNTGGLIATIGVINDNGTPLSIGDLSFQPGTGVLYGITSNTFSAGGLLYTINLTTAATTFIGDTGTGVGGGLGFAPNGTLYQLASGSVNVISPVDAHVISSVQTGQFYDGLGVRSDGVLFASTGGGSDAIYMVNPTSGQSTFLGNTGQGSVSDVDFRRSTARLTPRRTRHSNR